MNSYKFFTTLVVKGPIKNRALLPTIGVAGVTIPGALDCISKINCFSRGVFNDYQHPSIKLDQPDFSRIHQAQSDDRWDVVADLLVASIHSLTKSGADFAIIPANTVHKVIADVQARSAIPVLNMLDIVADACQQQGFKKVGVLGTRWTMAGHLYKEPFARRAMCEVSASEADQAVVQQAIFSELVPQGFASPETLAALLVVSQQMKRQGCDALALACTELPLVLNGRNCGMPTVDTNGLLAQAAVDEVLRLMQQPKLDVNAGHINRKAVTFK